MGFVSLGQGVLGGDETFRGGTVALLLRVLLVGIGDTGGPVAEVLACGGREGWC